MRGLTLNFVPVGSADLALIEGKKSIKNDNDLRDCEYLGDTSH